MAIVTEVICNSLFIILGFSAEKISKNNQKPSSSLYDKLQENKAAKQAEFYEESKEGSKMSNLNDFINFLDFAGRNLTDEDVKFLIAVRSRNFDVNAISKKKLKQPFMNFELDMSFWHANHKWKKPMPLQLNRLKAHWPRYPINQSQTIRIFISRFSD